MLCHAANRYPQFAQKGQSKALPVDCFFASSTSYLRPLAHSQGMHRAAYNRSRNVCAPHPTALVAIRPSEVGNPRSVVLCCQRGSARSPYGALPAFPRDLMSFGRCLANTCFDNRANSDVLAGLVRRPSQECHGLLLFAAFGSGLCPHAHHAFCPVTSFGVFP